MRRIVALIFLFALVGVVTGPQFLVEGAPPTNSATGQVYWRDFSNPTDNSPGLKRADLGSATVQHLVTVTGFDTGLDLTGGKIYWSGFVAGKVQRSNLDGTLDTSGPVSDEDYARILPAIPIGVAVDAPNDRVYWTVVTTDPTNPGPTDGKIQSASLSNPPGLNPPAGSITDVRTGLVDPIAVAVDSVGGKVYWMDTGTGKIHRANLDGTGAVEDLVSLLLPVGGSIAGGGIALDVAGGKMYWVDSTDFTNLAAGKIQRANLDGTGAEVLVEGLSPTDIALDLVGGKMYWTEGSGKIQRANLDGTGVEDVFTGLTGPNPNTNLPSLGGIALDLQQVADPTDPGDAEEPVEDDPPADDEQPVEDDTPVDDDAPLCRVSSQRSPLAINFEMVDDDSGIASIEVKSLFNATLELPAGSGNFYDKDDVITFSPPETGEITAKAVLINQKFPIASVWLRVTDAAGNVTDCE